MQKASACLCKPYGPLNCILIQVPLIFPMFVNMPEKLVDVHNCLDYAANLDNQQLTQISSLPPRLCNPGIYLVMWNRDIINFDFWVNCYHS